MNKNIQQSYTVFTDGSSRGNPGPGGWGAVIVSSAKAAEAAAPSEPAYATELGGREKETTNNRMELTAAAKALEKIPAGGEVTLYTDSSYVINGITKWVKGWKRNGWKTKTKGDVLNRDLWEELHELAEKVTVKWQYVGGHVGILGNERCDHIATAFADDMKIKLYSGSLLGYDLPDVLNISHDELTATRKKSDSSRSKAKAHSYVSMVDDVVETHRTWAECEKRVKGTRGARFKKALDPAEEVKIIEEFSTN